MADDDQGRRPADQQQPDEPEAEDRRPEDEEEESAAQDDGARGPEPDEVADQDEGEVTTWQPRRGGLARAIAWFIILVFIACVLAVLLLMIFAPERSNGPGTNPPARTQPTARP